MDASKKTHTKHVIISGETLFYDAKAPYETSGESIKGALEYDEATDKVKCHECGEFFSHLGRHSVGAHSLRAEDYKARHGLARSSALVSERIRLRLSHITLARIAARPSVFAKQLKRARAVAARSRRRAGVTSWSPERENSRRICNVQIATRLQAAAAQLGRAPSENELKEFGLNPSVLRSHFGSVARAFTIAGLQVGETARWTDTALLAHIKNFIDVQGRTPTRSDYRRGLLPNPSIYQRRFGSLSGAIRAALRFQFHGPLDPGPVLIRPVSAEKIRSRMRKRGREFWGVNIGKFAIGGMK